MRFRPAQIDKRARRQVEETIARVGTERRTAFVRQWITLLYAVNVVRIFSQ